MASFIKISPDSGNSNGTITVTVPEYFGRKQRTDKVKVYIEGEKEDIYDECEIIQEGRPSYLGAGNVSLNADNTHSDNLKLGRVGGNVFLMVKEANAETISVKIECISTDDISNILNYKLASVGGLFIGDYKSVSGTVNSSKTAITWTFKITNGEENNYAILMYITINENTSDLEKIFKFELKGDGNNGGFVNTAEMGLPLDNYELHQARPMSINPTSITISYTGGSETINVLNVGDSEKWIAEIID